MNMQNPAELLGSTEKILLDMIRNGDYLCGYFIADRRGMLPDSMASERGIEPLIENFPDWVLEQGGAAPESAQDWRGLFERIHRGEPHGSAMLTLKTGRDVFSRLHVRFNTAFDDDGKPRFAMISFDDFTQLSRQFYAKDDDINSLLHVAGKTFPEVMILNLTQESYRTIQNSNAVAPDLPREGSFNQMHVLRRSYVLEEDRAAFSAVLGINALKKAFLQEKRESVQLVYRRSMPGRETYWMETTVARQQNTRNDDLLLVAMVRNVDEQKAQENRLREEMRLQSEELRLTLFHMGKVISYYDIPRRSYSMPPYMTEQWGLPSEYSDFPDQFLRENPIGMDAEMIAALQDLFGQITSGKPSGSCEYPFTTRDGRRIWERMDFATIFDENMQPLRAIIAMDDVTAQHSQTEENARLRFSAQVLEQIAQHSDRETLYYDSAAEKLYLSNPRSEDAALKEYSISDLIASGVVQPESRATVARLQEAVRSGIPRGQGKVLICNLQGQRRWLDVKYSTLFDDENHPLTTLISVQDITQQHEHEIAYLRTVGALENDIGEHLLFMECDLNADRVEKISGMNLPDHYRDVRNAYSQLIACMIRRVFLPADQQAVARYFSIETLLHKHALGERSLKSEWQAYYPDGSVHWFSVDTTLIEDPYLHHVKVFLLARDVTEEKLEQLEMQRRAERDSMTGLLNRGTAEAIIRKKMAEENSNGILIVLDLDDLKGINDTFGHKEGDRAIIAIADTLRSHFRETDVIVRFGGDEFLIYLPGAAASSDVIAVSITGLLRKLSGISIDEGNRRRIHCSVGCAVQCSGKTDFDVLYRQADTALYHVKRTGKNNFAFYSPEMEQDSFQFQAHHLFSRKLARKYEAAELYQLLQAIASLYQLVISVNLSANDYYLMEEVEDGVFRNTPTFGVLDDFIDGLKPYLHPDDAALFMENLSRNALLQAHARGLKNLQLDFRFRVGNAYRRVEATVVFYENEVGNACEFSLLRWLE